MSHHHSQVKRHATSLYLASSSLQNQFVHYRKIHVVVPSHSQIHAIYQRIIVNMNLTVSIFVNFKELATYMIFFAVYYEYMKGECYPRLIVDPPPPPEIAVSL